MVVVVAAVAVALVVVVMVVVVLSGGAALTGRISRHSTTRLAVVTATVLMVAQLDVGVGKRHPQFRRERGVIGGPVREHISEARPRSVIMV
jgi:hypothetical protein